MDDRMTAEAILDHLGALAEWLRVKAPGEKHALYVVGGAAMALSGFGRTTYDVDLLKPTALPRSMREGANAVARSRRLANDWIGTGPAEIFRRLGMPREFPQYFTESQRVIEVGETIAVEVASRQALISLKLFAASPSTAKHLDDLRVLAPSDSEAIEAARFVLSVDGAAPRVADLEIVLAALGFDCCAILEVSR